MKALIILSSLLICMTSGFEGFGGFGDHQSHKKDMVWKCRWEDDKKMVLSCKWEKCDKTNDSSTTTTTESSSTTSSSDNSRVKRSDFQNLDLKKRKSSSNDGRRNNGRKSYGDNTDDYNFRSVRSIDEKINTDLNKNEFPKKLQTDLDNSKPTMDLKRELRSLDHHDTNRDTKTDNKNFY